MKALSRLVVLSALIATGGCEWFSPTKVKVRVVEHKTDASGKYVDLLYVVIAPEKLEGRYGEAATLRGDLIGSVDGEEYEIYLNFTQVPTLLGSKPLEYDISAPSPGNGDFLDSAKRIN